MFRACHYIYSETETSGVLTQFSISSLLKRKRKLGKENDTEDTVSIQSLDVSGPVSAKVGVHGGQSISLSLSLSLSLSQSLYLAISLFLSVYLFPFVCLSVSLSLSVYLALSLSVSLCLAISFPLCVSLSLCLSLPPLSLCVSFPV